MVNLRNNFDTGPDGTTLTTANSGTVTGNDAFNAISTSGTGSILQYKSTATFDRPTAEYMCRCETTNATSTAGVQWSTSMGSQVDIWFRLYMYLTGSPANNPDIYVSSKGISFGGTLALVASTGKFKIWNGPKTASSAESTNSLALNDWIRIEGNYHAGTGTSGYATARLYLQPDAPLEDYTEELSLTGVNMGTTDNTAYSFGWPSGGATYPAMYISGLALSNEGYLGPAPARLGKGSPPGNMSNQIAIHDYF